MRPRGPGRPGAVRAAALIMAAGLLAAGCRPSRPASPPPLTAPVAGRLTLKSQAVDDLKPVPGVLTTRDMADARARIGGVLTTLSVKAGDTVRRGQLIGRVTDARIGLQTGAYDAQMSAAAAQAAAANADLARTRDLFAHGVYAQARLDQVQAQAKAAQGALNAARAERAASAEQGAEGAILAPADGRVLTADTPAGSVVTPGQSIARITAGPVVVRITLPEGDAGALKVGDMVQLNADDLRHAATQGTVVQVYPAVTNGQVTADITAPNLPRDLVGQTVRAGVKVGQRVALVAPRRYIVTRFGVDYASLVKADGSLSETPVQTAAGPTADTVEILSGLRVGDVLAPAAPR